MNLLEQATMSATSGPPGVRLRAATLWVDVTVKWADRSALKAYHATIGLLDTILASGRSLESRHRRLASVEAGRTQTLAVDGAACAIGSGEVELAIEMLEQGRSVLLTQAGRYRTRVDELEATHPGLASQFRSISAMMDASAMDRGQRNPDLAPNGTTRDVVAMCVHYHPYQRRRSLSLHLQLPEAI